MLIWRFFDVSVKKIFSLSFNAWRFGDFTHILLFEKPAELTSRNRLNFAVNLIGRLVDNTIYRATDVIVIKTLSFEIRLGGLFSGIKLW